MPYQGQGMPLRQRDANVPLQKKVKGSGTLKLPPTAVVNKSTGEWEETDIHRLAQRRKQLYFGKVTQGYKHYVARVPREDRQEGNDSHPMTPRLNQVCSKRSWDCQVGKWRRSLHYWDSNPDPEGMRKCPEELKLNKENNIQSQPRLIPTHINTMQPTVKVKYTINGDDHCKLLITPLKTSFDAFAAHLEDKNGTLFSMYYSDADGDVVDVDDDVSLRSFLDCVAASSPPPKLCVDLLSHTPSEISKALHVLRSKLPMSQVNMISEKFSIDFSHNAHRGHVPQAHSLTPVKKPILPELVEMVTPTPEGKTPAMNVYNAMWTPESECKERRKLFC
eukprot:TRINITY_DN3028_c2_g1_i2.p1 TRINITY_DN3028_c2_g1~~TRINITY_DN3028_c2_g1_i2.p1  ORF type:complete len:334 (+),score=92.32 TRINITY_DN3028_c2_g1_i2:52-1053(+)